MCSISTSVLSCVQPQLDAREETASFRLVWREPIGTASGTPVPVVRRDLVLIGTNNDRPRLAEVKGKRGVVMAFRISTGAFLGQVTHQKLDHRSIDLNGSVLCRPCVDDDFAYYISNRGELVCLDLTAFEPKAKNSKVSWSLDFITKLNVFTRSASDVRNPLSSPIVFGDRVFAITGNGTRGGFAATALPKGVPFVPKPSAPSFVAVEIKTGKVAWSSAAPGKNLQYGQWASPAQAQVGDMHQILFPGGDGHLYGFESGSGEMMWKVDCNPKDATRWGDDTVGTRTSFMAAPVVRSGVAFVPAAIDLERADVPRPIYAVEFTSKKNAAAIKWRFHDETFGGSFGSVALGNDCLYALGGNGDFVCLDSKTGKAQWRSDLGADAKWFGSPVISGGVVYAAAGRKLILFQDGAKRVIVGNYEFDDLVVGSPAIAGEYVIVATKKSLYALRVEFPKNRK